MRLARLGEHARAEVGASDRSLTYGFQNPQARTGACAHIQTRAEGAERGQRGGGHVQHPVGGAERRVIELRGQPVIAALNRGQRLHHQFTHRRALRREHRPSVHSPSQAALRPVPGLARTRAEPPLRAASNAL